MIKMALFYLLTISGLAILFGGALVFAQKPVGADSILLMSVALFAMARLLLLTIRTDKPSVSSEPHS